MKFHPLYAELAAARIAQPGYMFPLTHYSPVTYIRAGGPFFTFDNPRVIAA